MTIEIRHITKSYANRFQALKDISLTFAAGELTALLGPSGCGKTTLLRIIAGLEQPDAQPDSGIFFDGEDVAHRKLGERRVGFVFQHYALFRHMTVFENIAFGLEVKPKAARPVPEEIRRRVCELIRLVQLDNFADRLPSQLSGGQRQRVALARALAIQPRVLLLDEPFGALDAKVRADLRRWLRRLHDELHITSVFVTHDQEEALEVADRVVVMNEGRLEQLGTPDAVFHQPASAFVMEFLGHVNVFHGRMEDGQPVLTGAGDRRTEGAERLLLRPRDLRLARERTDPTELAMRVHRVLTAGPNAKLELADARGETVHIVISHERLQELHLVPHDTVYVSVGQPKAPEAGGSG